MNKYNGKEAKCKSFAANDIAKERYHKYCKLDWLLLTEIYLTQDSRLKLTSRDTLMKGYQKSTRNVLLG
jgi:hypothetical protein